MIISQTVRQPPESQGNSYLQPHETLYHLSCKQLSLAQMRNDQILLNHIPLSRLIVLGRIVAADRATSPRGVAVINATLADSTGQCRIMIYYREGIEDICKKDQYIKLGVTIKCGGLPYRPEIKIVSHSVKTVHNFGELTEHYLECMKTSLIIGQ